jgi:Barstar (barnase inhibitor)
MIEKHEIFIAKTASRNQWLYELAKALDFPESSFNNGDAMMDYARDLYWVSGITIEVTFKGFKEWLAYNPLLAQSEIECIDDINDYWKEMEERKLMIKLD